MSRFELIYAQQTKQHLRAIEQKHHHLIRKTIEEQLRFEPNVETLNRKPLKRPIKFKANWELRLGPQNRFRVFYRVDHESNKVDIAAIGIKSEIVCSSPTKKWNYEDRICNGY